MRHMQASCRPQAGRALLQSWQTGMGKARGAQSWVSPLLPADILSAKCSLLHEYWQHLTHALCGSHARFGGSCMSTPWWCSIPGHTAVPSCNRLKMLKLFMQSDISCLQASGMRTRLWGISWDRRWQLLACRGAGDGPF